MPRRILSIDGGGVRGVIPATVLAAPERQLGGRVRDHFDFLAGTSTGALIAGAVAAGIPADRIVASTRRRPRFSFAESRSSRRCAASSAARSTRSAILDGSETRWLVTDERKPAEQYARAV